MRATSRDGVEQALRGAGAADLARWLVLDAEAVADVDASGVEALRELVIELRRDAVELVVARLKPHAYDRLEAGGVVSAIGHERFLPTVRAAVASCVEADASAEAPRHELGRRTHGATSKDRGPVVLDADDR